MNSSSATAGACCGAIKLSPLKMLYFDHDHEIKFDTLNDMVVDECGCAWAKVVWKCPLKDLLWFMIDFVTLNKTNPITIHWVKNKTIEFLIYI